MSRFVPARFRPAFDRAKAFLADARQDTRAVSAVEFAMIVPVMATLFLASVETTQGLQIDRKVSLTARALSDLASQSTVIADTEMTNILDASSDILTPFAASNALLVVTGIQIDTKGKATVAWSDHRNSARYTCGATIAVPTQLMPDLGTSGFLVLAEVKYNYQPIIGYLITGTVQLSDRLYTRPRIGDTISRTPSQGSGCI
ncbi:pilus assembly protein [Phreatobacter aquaticus]|uniref:Pilus assembly protein n=1 Tax=Phreatobacter aquaticus TaxID=2570229 RepID=A0A4D7QIX3_9HYPH|nr:TadE/TadG family type IV pilus assembly protein [Phreatobacter aquaticus]QCK85306.1 pilus assembly protein [Phreatobacter aquaticus]